MSKYANLKAFCNESSAISAKVVDDFLMFYAAKTNRLDAKTDKLLAKYKFIFKSQDPSWFRLCKAQLIVHHIFKAKGLIGKYLNHSTVTALPKEQYKWLVSQAATPWRFSFAIVVKQPSEDFFEMEDIFSSERYLLYSPSMRDLLQEHNYQLWFNLVAFNGQCWQSFGLIVGFLSFDADDIFFFATEQNPSIESDEDLLDDLEQRPLPYMMLMHGANYPVTVNNDDLIIHMAGNFHCPTLTPDELQKDFNIEKAPNKALYMLGLKHMEEFPHMAIAYYDQQNSLLQLTAMTAAGYEKLRIAFVKQGILTDGFPEIAVKPSMLITAGDILRRSIEVFPYEQYFEQEKSQEDEAQMSRLNEVLSIVMNDLNDGKTPDYDAIAQQTDVDLTTIKSIVENVIDRMGGLKKGKR